jgi:ammonium transporter Rh
MVRSSYRRYLAIIYILILCAFVCADMHPYRFGMLMLFLKKYAYSSFTYTLMLSVIVIQWHILVNGFFRNVFEGDWKKIDLSLTNLILADFAAASVLITFGAILGKVTKPAQLVLITLSEVIFYSINEEIGKELHISDIGGSMVIHAFGAYFGLGVSYVLTTPEAQSHNDNAANYTSDVFSMVGTIFLWIFWPSFNSALAGPYDQERTVINTVLALTASGVASFAASWYLRGEKKFDMVDIQNASIAGGVAVGTTANMMLGPVGAQVIGFLAGSLSVSGYVFIQPFLETRFGIFDTCGVHNLHGMPGVLAGIAGIILSGMASYSRYNTYGNYLAVFPYDEDSGTQLGYQAAFLFITLAISSISGLLTGTIVKKLCGELQPRVYNDDMFFNKAFR